MKYTNKNVPRGVVVWACAYSTNSTEKSMAKRKKPVRGIVQKNSWKDLFVEIKKNGELKSGSVSVDARDYADTEEECIEMYNKSIMEQIEKLEKLKQDCINDFIGDIKSYE